MNPLIELKNTTALLVIAVLLTCFALALVAQAVSPPPDGDYPNQNTAEGHDALLSVPLGDPTVFGNTAVGFEALKSHTQGTFNTAVGAGALTNNVTADNNTATGGFALHSNINGGFNTATGVGALRSNTGGFFNTGTGSGALSLNNGSRNTATGESALGANMSGFNNTATGQEAAINNRTGHHNTANGVAALRNNTTGSFNIALGNLAGRNLTIGSNNIDIGNQGVAAEGRTIRIGEQGNQLRTFIAGISGSPIIGTSVVVNNFGRLGTVASSQRFKDDIKPMDKASEAILALKPVTFRYKKEVDADCTPQFGLVAEDVERINPDLVLRDSEGKIYSVRYEAVNAMLLNEFLKEHRTVQELKSAAAKQEATIARQQKQIEALTAGLQKVSAQLEMSKPAPQTVQNNR